VRTSRNVITSLRGAKAGILHGGRMADLQVAWFQERSWVTGEGFGERASPFPRKKRIFHLKWRALAKSES